MKRPLSVTIVAWLIIALSIFSAIPLVLVLASHEARDKMTVLLRQSPIPVPLQLTMGCMGLLIVVICAAFMLRGRNWGRVGYIGWSLIGLVLAIVNGTTFLQLLPGVLKLAVFAYFLTRPEANRYFSAGRMRPDSGETAA